jgi:hypothetical protein
MQDICSLPATNHISRVGCFVLQLFWIYSLCCCNVISCLHYFVPLR